MGLEVQKLTQLKMFIKKFQLLFGGLILLKWKIIDYICIQIESWVSGLNQQFAKLSYA
jgi:hypothetical protein